MANRRRNLKLRTAEPKTTNLSLAFGGNGIVPSEKPAERGKGLLGRTIERPRAGLDVPDRNRAILEVGLDVVAGGHVWD